jgi:hypothetical protein
MPETDPRPNFQLDVTVPCESRFVPTIRDLAVQAARLAGCSGPDADAFGDSVQAALDNHMRHHTSDAPIAIVVRRDGGPLQVLVDEQTISLDL